MKHFIVLLLILLMHFPSCKKNKQDVITFDLKRTDYIETIDATGTVQAVNNMTLMTPRVFSTLTVIYLAKEGSFVKKGDTVCIIDSPELFKNVETYNGELEKMEADLRTIEADNAMELSLLEAQVKTNSAQMAITMLDSVQLRFAPPVKKKLLALEMEKADIEKKKLQKKLAAQRRINNSELMQVRSRIMMQKNRIQTLQTQINSLKLVAPCDGFAVHTEGPSFYTMGGSTIGGKIDEGSLVFTNMPLLQIPDVSKMQVSVEVPENDYKRINTNQPVLISVDAAENLQTTGKVKIKSLAGKKKEEKTSVKSYEVIISIDSCHQKIKPGLSAKCRIIIDNVKDTIVVPATAVFGKDSSRIVYVEKGGKFIAVNVETGLSNSSKTIIAKGLEGNETIALIEPSHNLISGGGKKRQGNIKNNNINKVDSLTTK